MSVTRSPAPQQLLECVCVCVCVCVYVCVRVCQCERVSVSRSPAPQQLLKAEKGNFPTAHGIPGLSVTPRPPPALIRTTISENCSGSKKNTIHLDHISRYETASGTKWSSGWTYRVFIMNDYRERATSPRPTACRACRQRPAPPRSHSDQYL